MDLGDACKWASYNWKKYSRAQRINKRYKWQALSKECARAGGKEY